MNLNQAKLNQVVTEAKSHTTDARWLSAIDRAVAGILAGWVFTEHKDYWLITTEGGTYKVNGVCDCKAGKNGDTKCKHRAFKRLITLYNETEATTPVASTPENLITEIEQRWIDRGFAARGYKLGDWLMKRFNTDDLRELKPWLPQIRAALK
jgi:hypothetical protein